MAVAASGADFWDPRRVEDDAASGVCAAGGDNDELGAPGGFAGAFPVQACIRLGSCRSDLTGSAVDDCFTWFGFEQWCDDLAVRVQHP